MPCRAHTHTGALCTHNLEHTTQLSHTNHDTRAHKSTKLAHTDTHTLTALGSGAGGKPHTREQRREFRAMWAKSVCDQILNQIHPSRPINLWTCTHTRLRHRIPGCRATVRSHIPPRHTRCRMPFHELGGLGSAESSILTIHPQPRLLRPSRLARPPRDHQPSEGPPALRGTTNPPRDHQPSEGPPTLLGTATRA